MAIALVVTTLLVSACGGGDTSTATRITRITITDSRFSESELRIAVGTTVVWQNDDPYAHTVKSVEGSAMEFDSGDLTQGQTFEVTFDEPGDFSYFCQIHPTMRAVVVVT